MACHRRTRQRLRSPWTSKAPAWAGVSYRLDPALRRLVKKPDRHSPGTSGGSCSLSAGLVLGRVRGLLHVTGREDWDQRCSPVGSWLVDPGEPSQNLGTAEPKKNTGPTADAHASVRYLRLLDHKLYRSNQGRLLRDPHRHHPLRSLCPSGFSAGRAPNAKNFLCFEYFPCARESPGRATAYARGSLTTRALSSERRF